MPGPMYVTPETHVRRKTCNHFVKYEMPCDEYDDLMARADYSCEMCGRKDWIGVDHDHANGPCAARGILCAKCNAHMRLVDSGHTRPSEVVESYLAGAWYLTTEAAAKRVEWWKTTEPYYGEGAAWRDRALAAEDELRRIKGEQ